MSKKLSYMVLDCETGTLPFADSLAQGDSELKKKIAIARPLIYDLGWVKTDRKGNNEKRVNYLVAETFSVPSIFNTAYYAEKRPIYLEMLSRGEITIKPWFDVMKEFEEDAATVDAVGAFNSMFDFKKAIPFTELYIKKLYSPDYQEWERMQYNLCKNIISTKYRKNEEKEFDADVFTFRGKSYPLFDLWGLAVEHLLNNQSYKRECIKNQNLTQSGEWFKTSAESAYQYLQNRYDFNEAHTALDDATIETVILSKIARKHAITPGIMFFPFRKLGTTIDYCLNKDKPNKNECTIVYNTINNYINGCGDNPSDYVISLINRLEPLTQYI